MNILDYWPDPSKEPRVGQLQFLNWVVEQDAKYLIAQVPVGGGKSLLGITLSRWYNNNPKRGNSFILTPQRILQSQYEQDFTKFGLHSLYGRNNFHCSKVGSSCDIGHLIKPNCSQCVYEVRKRLAAGEGDVILNYKMALLMFHFTEVFKERSLMIFDEAHTIEHHLVELESVSISALRLKKLAIRWSKVKELGHALSWVRRTYLPKLRGSISIQEGEVEPLLQQRGKDLSSSEIKRIREYKASVEHFDQISDLVDLGDKQINSEYVLVCDDHSLQFRKLYAREAFNNILVNKAQRFLFMSSTILDHKGFCQDLGININEVAYFEGDSDFPIKNRPIIYKPVSKMSYGWDQDSNISGRRKLANAVHKILKMHEGESGIIHTGNFKIAQWLLNELGNDITHKVFHHNKEGSSDRVDRNDVINNFTSCKEPGILISPSSTEGLDLKEDLGRFAIFIKVPFLSLQDQWVKRRMEVSKGWYQRQALISIIQGGGRIVRSKDDWGIVYILDTSWGYLFHQTYKIVPRWWLAAYNRQVIHVNKA